MSGDWQSRIAGPDDGKAIVSLFDQVFGGGYSISHWEWKYLKNPANKTCIFVADNGNKIVGHCALLPTWMNVKGVKILGAQRVDSMVHPDYRKQGLFYYLAEQCYNKAAEGGVNLFYHFPNKKSYSVSVNRLGSHDLGVLPQLVKIVDPKAIIKRKTHSSIIAAITDKPIQMLMKLWRDDNISQIDEHVKITKVDSFDRRFDDFWMEIKDSFSISLWKDSEYLNWRYCSCPGKEYSIFIAEKQDKLLGVIVLKYGDGQSKYGHIIDLLLPPEMIQVAPLLIKTGLEYFKDQGIDVVVCRMFDHSPYYKFPTDLGFFKQGESLPLLIRVLKPDLYTDVMDIKQWSLMEGDIDVY